MNNVIISIAVTLMCAIIRVPAVGASESTQTQTSGVDQRVWRGTPVRVDLPLGHERIIRFPGATRVRVGLIARPVPALRVQVLDNRIYLLAKAQFAAIRMVVRTGGRSSVLLDLAASKKFKNAHEVEVLTSPNVEPENSSRDEDMDDAANQDQRRPVSYIALVRHAARAMYAPDRLLPRDDDILQAQLHNRAPIDLVRGARVLATPIASWRAEGSHGALWVTAVELRNLLSHPVVLDPRDLRGEWRAACFQHARLGPTGDRETDSTTVYLVSDQQFRDAIRPWGAEADAEDAK